MKNLTFPLRIFTIIAFVFLGTTGCFMNRQTGSKKETLSETSVVNQATDTYEIYIGRRSNPRVHMLTEGVRPGEEGWLGNPHPIGMCDLCSKEHTRKECIEAFRADFHRKIRTDPSFRRSLPALKGKSLGCYCKPLACHGDVIRAFIESGNIDP